MVFEDEEPGRLALSDTPPDDQTRRRVPLARRAKGPRRPRYSLGARLRYGFDEALSRGPSVVIGWLGALTLAVITVAGLVIAILRLTGVNGGGRLGVGEAIWQSMLRVVDAGTFVGDDGWVARLIGLLVTLAGIFIAGSLIGLIANAVDQRIELLRKGRSAVLETDHTLILGWSERVPAIVGELILANESRRHAAIVVLSGEDKTMMEDTLRSAVDDFVTTRLVCRSGNTSAVADLDLVNLDGARSVIVIGGNDASVVKSLLAIRGDNGRPRCSSVVAEVGDPDTANSIRMLLGEHVAIVNSDSVVAELTAQACRQRGLSQVFHDLLDFDGDEIYFAPFPTLVGRTYREAQSAFAGSSVIGVFTAGGDVVLNPRPDTVIGDGDELIGIASDDSTFVCGEPRRATAPGVVQFDVEAADTNPRRMVLVGWSSLGPRVVTELDEFVEPGTTLEIVVDADGFDEDAVRSSVSPRNLAIEVTSVSGRPEEIVGIAAQRAFDEVIVLGRRDGVSAEEADSQTLLTLLAFNRLVRDQGLDRVRIVAELLDQRHGPLARATGADDFIVSDELTSLMIAQLSERRELEYVFRDLFVPEGSTIEMAPVGRYGATGAATFADVVAAASERGHSAIGYRCDREARVVLNPPKHDPVQLVVDDTIIVIR